MVDFTPPPGFNPEQTPAPLPATVALNPPMVGYASPFDRVDGQNRDLIIESIRTWARTELIGWAEAWQDYQSGYADKLGIWINGYVVSFQDYVELVLEQVINNSIELQDPVLSGIIKDNASLSHGELVKLIAGQTKRYNVKDYGAVGDGVADESDAIDRTIAAADSAGQIVFPPGRYLLSRPIRNTGKPLSFDATGATLLKNADFPHVDLTGKFDAIQYVAAIQPTTISEGGIERDGIVLTLASTPPWRLGDIVKVFSNDVIPETRDADKNVTANGRVGQYFPVWSVAGNVVTLAGVPVDTFTTGIRAARIQDIQVTWNGGTFDVTDAHIAAGFTSRSMDLANLANPVVSNVVFLRTTSMALAYTGCYNAFAVNVSVRWASDKLSEGALGYAVCNFSTQGLVISGLLAQSVRSGYTDGHGYIPVDNNVIQLYGRPMYTRITDSHADGCNAGFGTHSSGVFTMIDNCVVTNCYIGIAFRGRENHASNVTVNNSKLAAIRVFTEEGSRSYANSFDGVFINGCVNGIELYLNANALSTANGQMEVRPSVVRNVHARKVSRYAITVTNGTLIAEDIYAELVHTKAASACFFTNSIVYGENWRFDVNLTTVPGLALLQMSDATKPSRLQVDRLNVRGNMSTAFTKLVHTTKEHTVQLGDVRLVDFPSSTLYDTLSPDSWVDYQLSAPNERASSSIALNTAQITSVDGLAPLAWRRDAVIQARVVATAGSVFAALPLPAFQGQMLVVMNVGTVGIVMPHGVAYNTNLATGANVTIPAGQSLILMGGTSVWNHAKLV